ncbi:MAG: sigma-70 family RNA polymerase sigma factor [Myxococcaceae bacterium]|nr:sigma-70 family RNA polymerase sigma factor [Myxococcaceae bacterium]
MGRPLRPDGIPDEVTGDDDEACVRRLVSGDVRALGPLYGRYRGVVMNVLRHQVRDSELDDLCQEVFLTFAQVAERLHPGASVRSFLVGIAVKKGKKSGVMDWVRRTLIDRHVSREEPTTSPQLRVDAGRDAERLLAKLPDEWRTVVVLNVVEGWTAEEIAASLGVSPNTVFTRLYRARQRIKELTEGATP